MRFFRRKPNVQKLEESKDIEGLLKAAADRPEHRDAKIQSDAMTALYNILCESISSKDVQNVRKIHLGSKSNKIRNTYMKSIEGFGELKDKWAIEKLLTILHNPSYWHDAVKAALALGKIGDDRAVKPLMAVFTEESRQHYLFKIPYSFDPYRTIYWTEKNYAGKRTEHKEPSLYEAAALAMGSIVSQSNVDSLVKNLKEDHYAVTYATAAKKVIQQHVFIDDRERVLFFLNRITQE